MYFHCICVFCMCVHVLTSYYVVECVLSIMLSNDSHAHNVHMYVLANVGVMFEHSYCTCDRIIIIICTNGMGVRCSLLVTASARHLNVAGLVNPQKYSR